MKRQILLLVFLGIGCSVIASDNDLERGGLLSKKQKFSINDPCDNPCTKLGVCLFVTAEIGLFVGLAILIGSAFFEKPGAPIVRHCRPILYNRTEAECVSTEPSGVWPNTLQNLCGMVERHQECTPVCGFDIRQKDGIFPYGVDFDGYELERKLPKKVLKQFKNAEANEYEYAVCDDDSGPKSWINRIKSFFQNSSTPYWTIEGEKAPYRDTPLVGIVYPKASSAIVYSDGVYNEVLENPYRGCFANYGWCGLCYEDRGPCADSESSS